MGGPVHIRVYTGLPCNFIIPARKTFHPLGFWVAFYTVLSQWQRLSMPFLGSLWTLYHPREEYCQKRIWVVSFMLLSKITKIFHYMLGRIADLIVPMTNIFHGDFDTRSKRVRKFGFHVYVCIYVLFLYEPILSIWLEKVHLWWSTTNAH